MVSPSYLTEIYANMVSTTADNMITITRLVNNMMFVSMDAFKTLIPHVRDNAKKFSRIGVNSAKAFEQTSRETTATNNTARLSGSRSDTTIDTPTY
jgi:hypothetical protein